jgi:hypothetical protein
MKRDGHPPKPQLLLLVVDRHVDAPPKDGMDIEWNKRQEERKEVGAVAGDFNSECGAMRNRVGDRRRVPEEIEARKAVGEPAIQQFNNYFQSKLPFVMTTLKLCKNSQSTLFLLLSGKRFFEFL